MADNKKISPAGNNPPESESTRAARLEALKQSVQAGTYHIDTPDLADTLLSDLLWEQWERIRLFKP